MRKRLSKTSIAVAEQIGKAAAAFYALGDFDGRRCFLDNLSGQLAKQGLPNNDEYGFLHRLVENLAEDPNQLYVWVGHKIEKNATFTIGDFLSRGGGISISCKPPPVMRLPKRHRPMATRPRSLSGSAAF